MNQTSHQERKRAAEALAKAGFLAPEAEADALVEASAEGSGPINRLVARRLQGEPLAWITGFIRFCGVRVRVDAGVFVPRPHTEQLARRAAALLPHDGVAVDLCTGCGAVAVVLRAAHPQATVVATGLDQAAVACARANGVQALVGDLDEPLPRSLRGSVDLMTAVVPYVPSDQLHLLPRDVLANEPATAIDGGPRGTVVLTRAAQAAARLLRPGGTVLLEIGGDQAEELATTLNDLGLSRVAVHRDEDGQDRVIEAILDWADRGRSAATRTASEHATRFRHACDTKCREAMATFARPDSTCDLRRCTIL
ncbi:MAG: N5-glutamine methyltransferase family protein [Actinomycetota bacterium]